MSTWPGQQGPVSAKGMGGQITFDGHAVTIMRTGIARAMSGGGSTVVPIEQIAGVDFKPTGANHGYLTVIVAGTMARRQNPMKRSDDPLTVDFMRHGNDFRRVRDAIETALRDGAFQAQPAAIGQPPSTSQGVEPQRPLTADQLRSLAQLREQGHLSEEEFAAAKARLLGMA
jgi:hypothetical protein